MKMKIGQVMMALGVLALIGYLYFAFWVVDIKMQGGLAGFRRAYSFAGDFYAPPFFEQIKLLYFHFFPYTIAALAVIYLLVWGGDKLTKMYE